MQIQEKNFKMLLKMVAKKNSTLVPNVFIRLPFLFEIEQKPDQT